MAVEEVISVKTKRRRQSQEIRSKSRALTCHTISFIDCGSPDLQLDQGNLRLLAGKMLTCMKDGTAFEFFSIQTH
jgi:hypothetical protein